MRLPEGIPRQARNDSRDNGILHIRSEWHWNNTYRNDTFNRHSERSVSAAEESNRLIIQLIQKYYSIAS